VGSDLGTVEGAGRGAVPIHSSEPTPRGQAQNTSPSLHESSMPRLGNITISDSFSFAAATLGLHPIPDRGLSSAQDSPGNPLRGLDPSAKGSVHSP